MLFPLYQECKGGEKMNNKRLLSFTTACLLSLVGLTVLVNRANLPIDNPINTHATECSHHVGYYYLPKAPTIDEPGWVEFWACCKCGHQYIGTAPEGDWTVNDPSHMDGFVDENHIAYLPPLDSGGGDGDYWGKDYF